MLPEEFTLDVYGYAVLTQSKRADLDREMAEKTRWLDAWLKTAWAAIKRDGIHCEGIETHPLESLLAKYDTPYEKKLKRYLIMQEAVLTPLYGPLEGLPRTEVKEVNRDAGF